MTSMTTAHAQLERAHVQSKVIEANLERLGSVLSAAADPSLGDELASFTRGFRIYVGRLNDACTAANANDRGAATGLLGPESAEPGRN